jgi:hypothetical protein
VQLLCPKTVTRRQIRWPPIPACDVIKKKIGLTCSLNIWQFANTPLLGDVTHYRRLVDTRVILARKRSERGWCYRCRCLITFLEGKEYSSFFAKDYIAQHTVAFPLCNCLWCVAGGIPLPSTGNFVCLCIRGDKNEFRPSQINGKFHPLTHELGIQSKTLYSW